MKALIRYLMLVGLPLMPVGCGEGVLIASNQAWLQADDAGDSTASDATTVAPTCSAPAECAVDESCWRTSNSPWGTCTPQCSSNADCPGTVCMAGTTSVCSPLCTPWTNSDCPLGGQCHVMSSTGMDTGNPEAVTVCGDPGTQAAGANCGNGSGFCAPGLMCIGGTCFPLCRQGMDDCAAGLACWQVVPAAVVGGIEYGVCSATA